MAEPRGHPPRPRSHAPPEKPERDRSRAQDAAAAARQDDVVRDGRAKSGRTRIPAHRSESDRDGGEHETAETGKERAVNLPQRRLLYLFAILAAWAVIVVARLVQIQLVRHDYYVARAQRQQELTLTLTP